MQSSPLAALAHYKVLPKISSGPAMALAVAARAPYAMVPLGTMTAISASTGSVATGGLATGLVAVASAVAAPLIGRWADRRGERFVLSLLTPINALALLALLFMALQSWDGATLWLACVAVGGTGIPVGSFTRARWVGKTNHPRDLATAFSYESTVDELVFVLGPALVGVAASTANPSAPIAVAAGLVTFAGIPFALTAPRPNQEPPSGSIPDTPRVRPSIMGVIRSVVPSLIVMACIGLFFGSVQAAVTERATDLGSPGQAGLIYAVMGLGSAVTALLGVVVPERVTLSWRILAGGTGMAIFILIASAQSTAMMTAAVLLVTGLFIGPTMVTAFSLAERLSPVGGIAVAMTSIQSSVTVGVSLGASSGGALSASFGAGGGFAVGAAAGAIIAATGILLLLGNQKGGSETPTHPSGL